jgi:FlaG/FlaF family flagellin (archaellin)
MSGKAQEGSDYTLSGAAGQVIISAGQNSSNVTLSALADDVKEKKETAKMTLQPGSGYNFGTTGKKKKQSKAPSATVTILDGP